MKLFPVRCWINCLFGLLEQWTFPMRWRRAIRLELDGQSPTSDAEGRSLSSSSHRRRGASDYERERLGVEAAEQLVEASRRHTLRVRRMSRWFCGKRTTQRVNRYRSSFPPWELWFALEFHCLGDYRITTLKFRCVIAQTSRRRLSPPVRIEGHGSSPAWMH